MLYFTGRWGGNVSTLSMYIIHIYCHIDIMYIYHYFYYYSVPVYMLYVDIQYMCIHVANTIYAGMHNMYTDMYIIYTDVYNIYTDMYIQVAYNMYV